MFPFFLGLAVLLFFLMSFYNKLARLKNLVRLSFEQIDVQLKRRYGLVADLIGHSKDFLNPNDPTVEALRDVNERARRSLSLLNGDPTLTHILKNVQESESNLTSMLGRFFGLIDQRQDMKSNQRIIYLSEDLAITENKIAFAQGHFNEAVKEYNDAQEIFPYRIVVNFGKFSKTIMWKLDDFAAANIVHNPFE